MSRHLENGAQEFKSRRLTRTERLVLSTSGLLLAAAALVPILMGILAVPLQSAFELTEVQLGVAAGLFWVMAAASSPFAGRLADRLGWRAATYIAVGMSIATLLSIAFAVSNFSTLLIATAVAGVTYGLASPTGNLALAREVRAERRGFAFGVKQSAPPVASMVAGLAGPTLALAIGWRWVYIMAILPGLGAAGATLGFMWSRPRHEITDVTADSPSRRSMSDGLTNGRSSSLSPRTTPPLNLTAVTLAAGLACLATGVLTAFSVLTLVAAGFSPTVAGIVVALAGAGALGIRLGAGIFIDRFSWPPFSAAAWILAVGAIGAAMMATPWPTVAGAGMVIASAGVWGWPGLVLAGVVSARPADPGSATGHMQLGTNAGSAAGPVLFGLLVGTFGYHVGWISVAAVTAASAIAFASVGAHSRRRLAEQGDHC